MGPVSRGEIVIRRFWVPGPAVGKGRPRVERNQFTGKVHTRTPERTKLYQASIRDAFLRRYPNVPPMEEALWMTIEELRQRPRSHFRVKGGKPSSVVKPGAPEWPTSTPDLDNVAKAVLDGLNRIAWKDDSQVVQMTIRRRYASGDEAVGVMVEIGVR